MKLYKICLFFMMLLQTPCLAQNTLAKNWQLEKLNVLDTVPASHLKDKHILFVAGFMNEVATIISSYYTDNIEAAQEMGATTSYFGPSSTNSIPLNALILERKIRELYKMHKKKLVVVGHSKGGAELLYAILRHPDLIVNGIVDSVILIQPSIGGSRMAEKACEWCIDLITPVSKVNLTTVTPQKSKQYFDTAFSKFNKALSQIATKSGSNIGLKNLERQISNRIFYVRSKQSRNNISLGVETVLKFCEGTLEKFGPNDGLLLVDDQIDTRIGKDLGILESDHIDLTVSVVSNLTKKDRKTFTWALFKTIYVHGDLDIKTVGKEKLVKALIYK